MVRHKDWETKEELRENLTNQDPTVALALVSALSADMDNLPDVLPPEVTNILPPGGKIVVGISMTQAAYDALPDPSIYDNFAFFLTEN